MKIAPKWMVPVAALAITALATSARAEEWTKSYPISGRAQVRVDTNDGAVRVMTAGQTKSRFAYSMKDLN